GTDSTRRVTARNPLVIDSPRIAFLNLIGPEADNLLNQDKQALGNLFSSVETNGSGAPSCEVLMIYCDLNDDGTIAGDSPSLRDIIDAAAAQLIIPGSDHHGHRMEREVGVSLSSPSQ